MSSAGVRDGIQRRHDRAGRLRRESRLEGGVERERAWHRPEDEARGAGTWRRGPVEDGVEVGTWIVGAPGGPIAEIELGPRCTDDELLADPVATAPEVPAPPAGRYDVRSTLARLRAAGRARDEQLVRAAAVAGPPWTGIDGNGELAAASETATTVSARVHALVWGLYADELADLAEELFRAGRAAAALDVIGAAIVLHGQPRFHRAYVAYRRALGREPAPAEAALAPARPPLDARTEALLYQIRADPDDDAPRLVLADQLAGAFPEHAVLIVAQCGPPRAGAGELEEAFRSTLPAWLGGTACERGFLPVDELFVDAASFLVDHEDAFRCAPGCTALRLHGVGELIVPLAALPALRRYERLSLERELLCYGASHLACSPHLAQLRSLTLRDTHLSDAELRAILESGAYPRLERLDLGSTYEDTEQEYALDGLRALREAPFARALRSLDLDGRSLGDGVAPILGALPRLEALSIDGGALTDDGIRALAGQALRFVALDLRGNDFGPAGAAALAASPIIDGLEELDLRHVPILEAGLAALAASPRLRGLRALAIDRTGTGLGGAALGELLASAVFAPGLERLHLACSDLWRAGAAALASGRLARLEHLYLSGNEISDGVETLVRAPFFPRLRYLNLDDNWVDDFGARALAGADSHPELILELDTAYMSDGARAELVERFGSRARLLEHHHDRWHTDVRCLERA